MHDAGAGLLVAHGAWSAEFSPVAANAPAKKRKGERLRQSGFPQCGAGMGASQFPGPSSQREKEVP